ncbi:hypothetical protein CPB84DRAFT_1735529 [Gymnopilus junonius]|uniref:DUF6534 domain-containing protein n=1 Tax=Gymnopilus junonius TaxID=109634 RepID=A0A9P5NDJ7_GYMJU|nr:hypothetical protein CPB84DRAFT_1735529 [Gymnopilus junonius]
MSSLPALPPDIARTVGPLVVGYLFHWGLFGTLTTQVYLYFIAFSTDPRGSKLLVYGVYAAEFVQTVLITQSTVRTFGTGFGNLNAVVDEGNLWFSVLIMSSFIAFVVQAFFAYHINVLSRSYILPGCIFILSLVQLGAGISTGVIAHQSRLITDFVGRGFYTATGTWNGASVACDVLIASGMTYYLTGNKTHWKDARRISKNLVHLVIETGTLTATVSVVNLSLSLLPGKPTYFQASCGVLGGMYSTTMMVVFNRRLKIDGTKAESSEHAATFTDINIRKRQYSTGMAASGGVLVTQDQFTVTVDDWDAVNRKASNDQFNTAGA